jgi:hypothetical protein
MITLHNPQLFSNNVLIFPNLYRPLHSILKSLKLCQEFVNYPERK